MAVQAPVIKGFKYDACWHASPSSSALPTAELPLVRRSHILGLLLLALSSGSEDTLTKTNT